MSLKVERTLFKNKSLLINYTRVALLLSFLSPALSIASGPRCTNIFGDSKDSGVQISESEKNEAGWLSYVEALAGTIEVRPNSEKTLREALHNRFLIKSAEIPESYITREANRIIRARKYSDEFITATLRAEVVEAAVREQAHSLDAWIEFMISPNTQMYPMWFKYWMFNGITRLSNFSGLRGEFSERTMPSVEPFAKLNEEAIGMVVDMFLARLNVRSLDEIRGDQLHRLVEKADLGKMYAQALNKLGAPTYKQFATTKGRWVVYKKKSDSKVLTKDLEGKDSRWGIAESYTAKWVLGGSEVHIYYSLDARNNPTIPRLMLRLRDGVIEEVQGVSEKARLDEQILNSPILANKVKELDDGGRSYLQKVNDMKMLAEIERNNSAGLPLSKQELRFLYGIDRKIEGFQILADARIREVKETRDVKDDLVRIFEGRYSRHEISTTKEEYLEGRSKCHYGDLEVGNGVFQPTEFRQLEVLIGNLNSQSNILVAAGFKAPIFMRGDLTLGIKSFEGFVMSKDFIGKASFPMATSGRGLNLEKGFRGSLFLESAQEHGGMRLPRELETLYLPALKSAKGLNTPRNLFSLYLGGLESGVGLVLPDRMSETLELPSWLSLKGYRLPNGLRYIRGGTDF